MNFSIILLICELKQRNPFKWLPLNFTV